MISYVYKLVCPNIFIAKNKIKISKDLLVKLYINEEKSFRTIGKELGVGKTTIEYYLKKYEIKRRDNLEISRKNNFKAQRWIKGLSKEKDERVANLSKAIKEAYKRKREERIRLIEKKFNNDIKYILEDLYVNKKLNLEEVGKQISYDRKIVSDLLTEYNIPKRERWEHISSQKGKNHSQYGKTWEEVRGKEKADRHKKIVSKSARKHIISKIINREIPFKDTQIEIIMKNALIKNNIDFEFQYPIGKFVCDFAIPKLKIAIECDGDYWHANPKLYDKNKLDNRQRNKLELDKRKNEYLEEEGWVVLRFYETEIKKDISSCIVIIKSEIKNLKKLKVL